MGNNIFERSSEKIINHHRRRRNRGWETQGQGDIGAGRHRGREKLGLGGLQPPYPGKIFRTAGSIRAILCRCSNIGEDPY